MKIRIFQLKCELNIRKFQSKFLPTSVISSCWLFVQFVFLGRFISPSVWFLLLLWLNPLGANNGWLYSFSIAIRWAPSPGWLRTSRPRSFQFLQNSHCWRRRCRRRNQLFLQQFSGDRDLRIRMIGDWGTPSLETMAHAKHVGGILCLIPFSFSFNHKNCINILLYLL